MGAYGSPEFHPAINGGAVKDVPRARSQDVPGKPAGAAYANDARAPSPPPPPPDLYAMPPLLYPPRPYPPSAYGVAPYADSGYRTESPYPASAPTNGAAIKSFVIGVIAIAFSWIPLAGIVFGAPAVILGGIGLSRASRIQGTGKGFAIAGLVLGAISFLVMIVVSVILIVVSKPTR